MRFILTCGGSGGHINPALAVARVLREEGHEVLFVGAPQGMESTLVPREGFNIETVEVRSLAHSLKPKALARNMSVALKMVKSLSQAKKIIRRFKPHAVLGTGGYASFPALYAASHMKIPVLVHDSNAFPGVVTRLISKRAAAVLVVMESCRKAYKNREKVHVVGMPVRPEFFAAEKHTSREALRLDNRPVVVSIFGSQGASEMNRVILDVMRMEDNEWQHIHAAGPKAYNSLVKLAAERGLVFDGTTGLRLVDYIYNMAQACAAADVLICRSGGSTIAELSAAGRPAVLIPSPNVTADHQTANAKMLEEAGGAVVLAEDELTPEKLFFAVKELLRNKDAQQTMQACLKTLAVPDSARKIADMMVSLGL